MTPNNGLNQVHDLMLTNKEACRKIVQECKEALKTETDPEKRYRIALYGSQFNILMLQQAGKAAITEAIESAWGLSRRCGLCKKYKPVDQFPMTYSVVNGKKYTARRKQCKSCLNANHKEYNLKRCSMKGY